MSQVESARTKAQSPWYIATGDEEDVSEATIDSRQQPNRRWKVLFTCVRGRADEGDGGDGSDAFPVYGSGQPIRFRSD